MNHLTRLTLVGIASVFSACVNPNLTFPIRPVLIDPQSDANISLGTTIQQFSWQLSGDIESSVDLTFTSVGGTTSPITYNFPGGTRVKNLADLPAMECTICTWTIQVNYTGLTAISDPRPIHIDSVAPTVVVTVPADGGSFLPTGQEIIVQFSEGMDAASVPLAVTLDLNGTAIVLISKGAVNNTFTFVPETFVPYNSSLTLTVSTAALDLAGNPMSAPWVSTIVTGDPPHWNTYAGSTSTDGVNDIVATLDGGCIVTGLSSDLVGTLGGIAPILPGSGGGNDVWIVKYDAAGGVMWHTFAGMPSFDEQGFRIRQLSDGGYILAGTSSGSMILSGLTPINAFAGNGDIWIIRYSASGIPLWHTYAGSAGSTETIAGLAITDDGGFLIGASAVADIPTIEGQTPRNAYSGASDTWVVKYDASGHVQWHTFAGDVSGSETLADLTTTQDGGFAIVAEADTSITTLEGQPAINPFDAADAVWIVKYDSNGSVEWHTFGGSVAGGLSASGITELADGTLVACATALADVATLEGQPPLLAYSFNDIWLVAYNSSGNLLWHTFAGSNAGSESVHDVKATPDGGFMFAGDVGKPVDPLEGLGPINPVIGGLEAWIVKYTASGHVEWHTYAGSATTDSARGIVPILGGGYAVAVSADAGIGSLGGQPPLVDTSLSGGFDWWTIKMNADGTY